MLRLRPDRLDRRYIRRLFLTLFVVALVAFVVAAAELLLLVFGAALIAVLLSAVADGVAKRTPLPRGIALTLAVLLMLTAIATIFWLFGAQTFAQAERLGRTLPVAWAELQARLEANPLGAMLARSLRDGVSGNRIANWVLGAGWGAGELLVNFLIILIGGVFFAAEPQRYARGLILIAPPAYRPVAADAVEDVRHALRRWLATQLVSMVMLGTLIGLGLWWAGVDSPLALGLLGGLSEFIPYVGPTLAMIPALILALVGHGSLGGVLATYAIVRVVQTNIVTPLISQRLVSVPPGLYLFLILAMGYALGTFGLFFAGALGVVAYTLAVRLYARETLGDDVKVPGSGGG